MLPFLHDSKDSQSAPDQPAHAAAPAAEAHPLDALTGGAFSAATSGERAQRVRDWIATDPSAEDMQAVYKELSAKDRGAAKALRDRLEELRRSKTQDAMAEEWRVKGQALLDAERLHIADALAWQRDAAKAGAPLARPPLSDIRDRLTQRVSVVEDLQQRVMVQREAAALLAQRIELLSTNAWSDASAQQTSLEADIARWHEQSQALTADAHWSSVELRYPPQLESAQTQLDSVWSAFNSALAQARAAAADANAPLPPVPVWAEELRNARTPAAAPADAAAVNPEERAAAAKTVEAGVKLLEQAVAAGHTKDMHGATQALRRLLKMHGALIDDALAARVHQVLVSAGEMSGWQRWSADQLREQLVARAEALLVPRKKRRAETRPNVVVPAAPALPEDVTAVEPAAAPEVAPADLPAPAVDSTVDAAPAPTESAAAPTVDSDTDADASVASGAANTEAAGAAPGASTPPAEAAVDMVPAMGGHKLQEEIRKLRDEWKAADRGGAPNQALWRRFDRACNAAYAFVEVWLEKVRAEAAQAKAERVALIDELKAWAATQQDTATPDWKDVNRKLRSFVDRWRNGGHVGEKAYAELHAQWKAALDAAAAPLEAAQKENRERRQALIAEAEALGAAPGLQVAAIKALQQRWAEEARAVPLARKHEQKLWDAFRKPLDDAFKRRDAEREQARSALNAHDRAVLDASKALEVATASGDAARIRAAMSQLEAVTQGQMAAGAAAAPASVPTAAAPTAPVPAVPSGTSDDLSAAPPASPVDSATGSAETASSAAASVGGATPAAPTATDATPPAAAAPAPKSAKPVVAVRGDDRPGARKSNPESGDHGRGFADRRDRRFGDRRDRERPDRHRFDDRGPRPERGPRLGNEAFRAQRDAASHAQAALRELAAQAHGEALVQLLGAWQARQADQVPDVHAFGRTVTPAMRGEWVHALAGAGAAGGQTATALLRLEVAADVPTPADQVNARRALKLQLLTQRNDPQPAETWGHDTAVVLASAYDQGASERLRAALKVLMRGPARA